MTAVGFRYTRPRVVEDATWPISPTSCWRATGRQRFTWCLELHEVKPADAAWISACFRRRQPHRPAVTECPLSAAGWTPSRIGGKLRPAATAIAWSPVDRPAGVVSASPARAAALESNQPTAITPDESLRSRRHAPQPRLYRLCPGHRFRGWSLAGAQPVFQRSPAATVQVRANSASS